MDTIENKRMITSKTQNENYFGYLILEIIMVTVITFLGVAFIVFYGLGRADTRSKSNHLEYLFDHPFIFGLICLLPAILAVASLLYFRNRNYIIAYLFDDESAQLTLKYRGIINKSAKLICIPYDKIRTKEFSEKKLLFNQTYKGKRVFIDHMNLKLDFVSNNFIWEEQPKEKVAFLQELERISSSY